VAHARQVNAHAKAHTKTHPDNGHHNRAQQPGPQVVKADHAWPQRIAPHLVKSNGVGSHLFEPPGLRAGVASHGSKQHAIGLGHLKHPDKAPQHHGRPSTTPSAPGDEFGPQPGLTSSTPTPTSTPSSPGPGSPASAPVTASQSSQSAPGSNESTPAPKNPSPVPAPAAGVPPVHGGTSLLPPLPTNLSFSLGLLTLGIAVMLAVSSSGLLMLTRRRGR
jgi:hypothetical protein